LKKKDVENEAGERNRCREAEKRGEPYYTLEEERVMKA
jgi:hypothetical protein